MGMYAEEAGELDFVISSAGHSSTRFVSRFTDYVLTSDGTATFGPESNPTSCILSSRDLFTGKLIWRRNVCSSWSQDQQRESQQRHAVVSFTSTGSTTRMHNHHHHHVITCDSNGSVRSWNGLNGDLEWETKIDIDPDNTVISISKTEEGKDVLYWVKIEGLDVGPFYVLEASTGKIRKEKIHDSSVLVSAMENNDQTITCPSHFPHLEFSIPSSRSDQQDATSYIVMTNDKNNDITTTSIVLDWEHQQSDAITALFPLFCEKDNFYVLISTKRATTSVVQLHFVTDSQSKTQVIPKTLWTDEEGLSSVTAAALLDASHFVPSPHQGQAQQTDFRRIDPKTLLSFSSRLSMHWNDLQQGLANLPAFWSDYNASNKNRNDNTSQFGFHKIAVLLSNRSHRIYGISTANSFGKGQTQRIKYRYDLPLDAAWHRLVQGAPNARKIVRGIHGKAPSPREILVLSWLPQTQQIVYSCLDGTTGQLHATGSISLPSPVSQVIPMASTASSSPCRQGALLVLDDLSTAVIPPEEKYKAQKILVNSEGNGWFAHRFRQNDGLLTLESLQLYQRSNGILAHVVGMAQFPEERIVAVAYPSRDEVIASPCHVLGDQSLLLKYINPHLAVVITTTTAAESARKDAFGRAFLDQNAKQTKTVQSQKRKPAGAGTPPEEQNTLPTSEQEDPNLFVNVLDTVSGRVLYRISHSQAILSSVQPTVVVSENWIFYTFVNSRTRRAELGVLSLYEGMVDSKGLAALHHKPDQLTQFSSLENVREAKPVVLAKTFALPKPVTAMGVTATRGGISGKRLILATLDGSVFTVDRKILDPRRPMGPLKEAEKLEGLRQYSELVPLITYLALSHTLTVEGVRQIISTTTDLESQTLVLAVGGPDIFFARTSPSRGFDLLPDSFNRVMLATVLIALIALYFILHRVVANKSLKKGWP